MCVLCIVRLSKYLMPLFMMHYSLINFVSQINHALFCSIFSVCSCFLFCCWWEKASNMMSLKQKSKVVWVWWHLSGNTKMVRYDRSSCMYCNHHNRNRDWIITVIIPCNTHVWDSNLPYGTCKSIIHFTSKCDITSSVKHVLL